MAQVVLFGTRPYLDQRRTLQKLITSKSSVKFSRTDVALQISKMTEFWGFRFCQTTRSVAKT